VPESGGCGRRFSFVSKALQICAQGDLFAICDTTLSRVFASNDEGVVLNFQQRLEGTSLNRISKLLCVAVLAIPAAGFSQVTVAVGPTMAPPAPMTEMPATAPYPDAVWQPGYYKWDGAQYVWVGGTYVHAPYTGAHWVSGHWSHRGGRWVWVPGHFRH
jgi:hypothetical protein